MSRPMDPQTALTILNDAVVRGMAFLDQKTPDWFPRVLQAVYQGEFSITSCHRCALALAVQREYDVGVERFHLSKLRQNLLGFAAWGDTSTLNDSVVLSEHAEACEVLSLQCQEQNQMEYRRLSWGMLTRVWEWHLAIRQAELSWGGAA